MTKPREKTREELQAEIEGGKKKIRQFENREKMLRQKLFKEERRTRSHRLIVRGVVFESIVPEAKGMTNEESPEFDSFFMISALLKLFTTIPVTASKASKVFYKVFVIHQCLTIQRIVMPFSFLTIIHKAASYQYLHMMG